MDTSSSSSKKKANGEGGSFLTRVATVASRALTANGTWEDKDEFLDVIYWIRQITGLVLGIIWGLLSLKGIFAIIL